jgi:hypothetical protein
LDTYPFCSFPFSSSLNEKDELVFNLEKFPNELKQILFYFDEKIKNE